ncbi:hypothetical protein AA0311_2269 [Asaia bogorensis NBRC 16594]|uniref:Uncharacterized protein n=1 Tax=Asaia bogorensis NBRC 16594 TaxID=1231624 RepID=A0AAN4R1F5_9PROT|nr:hypothetical protein AA0311_2269 [Asaia bogorensis NBRC 16594]GEL52397.1 hypothetical protein ABO01nite_04040 [Asaia bogorensis NBRC 16594]
MGTDKMIGDGKVQPVLVGHERLPGPLTDTMFEEAQAHRRRGGHGGHGRWRRILFALRGVMVLAARQKREGQKDAG